MKTTNTDTEWMYELVVNGYNDDNEGLSFEAYVRENWVNYYPDLDNFGWGSLSEEEHIQLENQMVKKITDMFPWYK